MAKRNYKEEYKKFHASKGAISKRATLNKINRDKGTYGNGDNMDWSHQKDGSVKSEESSVNKGRSDNSQGDRNARGKGSKRKIKINKKSDKIALIESSEMTDRQKSAMKRHAKHHTVKHIKMMIKLMKQGKPFTEAHEIAMKKVGK